MGHNDDFINKKPKNRHLAKHGPESTDFGADWNLNFGTCHHIWNFLTKMMAIYNMNY